jgi:hypothetical protein
MSMMSVFPAAHPVVVSVEIVPVVMTLALAFAVKLSVCAVL